MTRCVYTARKASPTIFAVYTTPSQTIENCCRAFVPASAGDQTRAYRVGSHRSRINHRFLTDFLWAEEQRRWYARWRSWSLQLAGFSGDSAVASSGYAAMLIGTHVEKIHDALNFTLICLIVKSIFKTHRTYQLASLQLLSIFKAARLRTRRKGNFSMKTSV